MDSIGTPIIVSENRYMRIIFWVWHILCTITMPPYFLSMIVIGSVFYNDCPIQDLIPKSLIGVGVLGLFEEVWRFTKAQPMWYFFYCAICVLVLGLHSSLTLNYSDHPHAFEHCSYSLYMFYLSTVIILNAFVAMLVCLIGLETYVIRRHYTRLP